MGNRFTYLNHMQYRVFLLFLSVMGLFFVLQNVSAQAQAVDMVKSVYSVRGVKVDANADTAAAAQKIALADGQNIAAEKLLKRITPLNRHADLPEADSSYVSNLVQSMEVLSEKRSSTRYLAELVFNFRRGAVRRLLRNLAIPFSETMSKPVLILPIYDRAGAANLWDDPNPWRDAWQNMDNSNRFVPLIVPKGGLHDMGAISVDQAVNADAGRLAAIAARYEVETVIIVHAIQRRNLASGTDQLNVAIQRFSSTEDSTVIESFKGKAGETLADLMENAASGVASLIEENWKLATRLGFSERGPLSVHLKLSNLADWITLKRRLESIAAVDQVELRELTRNSAQVFLHHLGDESALMVALTQSDLSLKQEEGFWVLQATK
ncbi:MAG: DUF2066 domain-containing protein [Alphaproteobacteria bacterium]|jgi:hypothetical protein|nr:DUF2066 domain-containing protein [Alphaproteobacteria bacterium]MBT4017456.1 DUF2066 domain-containing protein [Alphaproteobacteria bacterium]MBT4966721.1 DUF2066 domain-containing protein [Alphaproteobacteria bacterium]MBT5158323.1 DUF2066 domain-containing protein [Alphaproteobacteria bacterium]MBT5918964.1 DUF2066 domain-containing protein [Alphaproteobacteria bacterium]